METSEVKPTTITGVKRLAKQIKKERSITHAEALTAASRQAGWLSWNEAIRNMPT
jgi:hypothetical protein